MKNIYLDHTATTPLDPEVLEAMRPYFIENYGNASSIHSFGQEAKAALDESRDVIAKLIGASSGEVIFVSGGTEADNSAIKGAAYSVQKVSGKNHIITDKGEHHAVLETCWNLKENGFSLSIVDLDQKGMVPAGAIEREITDATALITIMHANNEVGTINPVAAIATAAKAKGILVHADAVQSFGKIPVNANDLGVDLLSLSAHKIYGPKGIGALYIRKGTSIEKFMHGGGQERGRRGGTENVPLAVGFAKAALLCARGLTKESERLLSLRREFRAMLVERFPFLLINGDSEDALPHILNVSFDSAKLRIDGEALLFNLDLAGIAVTSGSACTSGSIEPSHVLLAMGRAPETAKATIRFSMGRSTTLDQLRYVAEKLDAIVGRIGVRK